MNQNTKMLIGAVIAAALAIAVYYGAISQQTASNLQGQANQTLGTAPATQQGTPANPQTQGSTPPAAPAPETTAPQNTAPQNTAPQNTAPQNTPPAAPH